MINCKNAMRQMPHFIDGTLAERLDSRVAGHLATCRACDAAYGSLLVAEASLQLYGMAARDVQEVLNVVVVVVVAVAARPRLLTAAEAG